MVARIEDHYHRLWDVPGENDAVTGEEEEELTACPCDDAFQCEHRVAKADFPTGSEEGAGCVVIWWRLLD